MKKTFCLLLASLPVFIVSKAQTSLQPGGNMFEKKWIRNGPTEMAYYVINGGEKVEICTFSININSSSRHLAVYTRLQFLHSDEQWIDTCLSNPHTFEPVYRASYSKDKEYVFRYGKEVTGYYLDKKTQKRSMVKEPVKGSFFDSYTYPYLLGLLPLTSGYKTNLSVYEYKPGNSTNVKNARINEVKSSKYVSGLTGDHNVWQVSVLEEGTGDRFEYYIDKDSRRIWRIDIQSKGQQMLLLDKEIDYNPFTTTFNKEETLKMITTGSGVITGQAYARDNENGGLLKGMAILNINKKQYAQAGTTVVLIPYTAFFKEWMALNEKSRKKGKAIPLPKEVAECIKTTTVYDEKGNFEFVNLMPGDYLLYTEFGYVHSFSRTEVVGYTDTYINGMFQYSTANTTTNSYSTNASVAVKKVVTLKKEGEKASVKLKKTK